MYDDPAVKTLSDDQVKTVQDDLLPKLLDDFDIQKYEFTHNLDFKGWLDHLDIRKGLHYVSTGCRDTFNTDTPAQYLGVKDNLTHSLHWRLLENPDCTPEFGMGAIYGIRRDLPVAPMRVLDVLKVFAQLENNLIKQEIIPNELDQSAKAALINLIGQEGDILRIGHNIGFYVDSLPNPTKEEIPHVAKNVFSLCQPYTRLYKNTLKESIKGEVFFRVDHDLPDKVLIETFKKQLSSLRTVYPQKSTKKITIAEITKWADARVLAYMDIINLSLYWNVKITDAIIGKLLFPDHECTDYDFDRTDKLRKVTKKYYNKLLIDGSLFDSLVVEACS